MQVFGASESDGYGRVATSLGISIRGFVRLDSESCEMERFLDDMMSESQCW